tara:strand:- start:1011 stop:1304 length:294 start_codon:yes stop_codon:yes gene_type:complete
MTNLQKIENLIKSNDESNWKLAFELSHLLNRSDKISLKAMFLKKATNIMFKNLNACYNVGIIPYSASGNDDSFHSGILVKIINDLTKIIKDGSRNVK